MKQSEAVKLALESYYFQHGRRTNYSVVSKVEKAIKRLEKLENDDISSNYFANRR